MGDMETVMRFKAMLADINCLGGTIQSLSALMRAAPPSFQSAYIAVWKDNFKSTSPTHLLPMVYLANDVIQMLRQGEAELEYKYSFAIELAQCLESLHIRHPKMLTEVFRIFEIWRRRHIIDKKTIDFLERATQGKDVLELLQDHVTEQQLQNYAPFHNELAQSNAVQGQDTAPASQAVAKGGMGQPPPDEDVEGHDLAFLRKFRALMASFSRVHRDIREKRHFANRLESQNLVLTARGAADQNEAAQGRIEVLLKKEWQLRAHKSHVLADVFLCLDSRHALLVDRLKYLCESIDIMRTVEEPSGLDLSCQTALSDGVL